MRLTTFLGNHCHITDEISHLDFRAPTESHDLACNVMWSWNLIPDQGFVEENVHIVRHCTLVCYGFMRTGLQWIDTTMQHEASCLAFHTSLAFGFFQLLASSCKISCYHSNGFLHPGNLMLSARLFCGMWFAPKCSELWKEKTGLAAFCSGLRRDDFSFWSPGKCVPIEVPKATESREVRPLKHWTQSLEQTERQNGIYTFTMFVAPPSASGMNKT